GRRGRHLGAVDGQDRLLVGRVVVAGQEPQGTAFGPAMPVGDDGLHVLGIAGPGDDPEDQLVLGVLSLVIPPITALVIGRVGRIAGRWLLEDERPVLVELDLTGLRGKKPRARRGVAGRARPPVGRRGPRCGGSRPPAGPWPARRCGRPGGRSRRGPCLRASNSGTRGCPCARRTGPCRCGKSEVDPISWTTRDVKLI